MSERLVDEILLIRNFHWVEVLSCSEVLVSVPVRALAFLDVSWVHLVLDETCVFILELTVSAEDLLQLATKFKIPAGCLLYLFDSFVFEFSSDELFDLFLELVKVASWSRVLHVGSIYLPVLALDFDIFSEMLIMQRLGQEWLPKGLVVEIKID